MSDQQNNSLSCYIIPGQDFDCIIPQSCVADVVAQPEVMRLEKASAGWIVGHCLWQHQRLSVLQLDKLLNAKQDSEVKNAMLVVLTPIADSARLVYSSLLCDGDVKQIEIDSTAVFTDTPEGLDRRYVEKAVLFQDETYIIPKLPALAVAFSYI